VRAAHQRAIKRAERAITAYSADSLPVSEDEEVVGDLIADLMHYAHELQVNREIGCTVEELIATATMHFNAEIEETE